MDWRSGDPDTLGEVKGLVAVGETATLGGLNISSEKMSVNHADLESVVGDVGDFDTGDRKCAD